MHTNNVATAAVAQHVLLGMQLLLSNQHVCLQLHTMQSACNENAYRTCNQDKLTAAQVVFDTV